jgi:signal transduction histidine kinase
MLHDRDMKTNSLLKISRFFPALYLLVTVIPMLALLYWNHERLSHVNTERRRQISAFIAKDIEEKLQQHISQEANRLDRLVNTLDHEKNVSVTDYKLLLEIDSLARMPESENENHTPFWAAHQSCIKGLRSHLTPNSTITGGYCIVNHKLETAFLISAAHHSELLAVSEPVDFEAVIPHGRHQTELFEGQNLTPKNQLAFVPIHFAPPMPQPGFGGPPPFGHPPCHHPPFDSFHENGPDSEHFEHHFQPHFPDANHPKDHFGPPEDNGFSPPPPFEHGKKPCNVPFHPNPKEEHGKLEKTPRQIVIHDVTGHPIATVVLHLPERPPASKGDDNAWFGTLILITGLISSTLIGFYIERTFIVPLTRLSLLTENVQAGDLSQRVSTSHVKHQEVRETLNNFNQMLEGLEEKEKLRHNFISNLTHDFRTPLIAQARALELLIEDLSNVSSIAEEANTGNSQAPLHLLRSLLRNNEHLLTMVNQLLITYQYESGNLTLNWEPIVLPDLINDCFSRLEPLSNLHQITLQSDFSEDFPSLEGDTGCLSRIFMNLIGNAIENIPKGCAVKVSGIVDNQDPDTVIIHVRDNGQGLPAEMLDSLFERYATATNVTRKIGSGIGLYICKMFVEAHGGSISVESVSNSHTDFQIRLPITQKGS